MRSGRVWSVGWLAVEGEQLTNIKVLAELGVGWKGKGEGDPAGTKEAEANAEIEELQNFIEQAKKWGMGTEEVEGKLTQLQTETQTPTPILTEAMNLKDFSAEKYRRLNLHTKNKEQMQTKAEQSTAALQGHKEARTKALDDAKK